MTDFTLKKNDTSPALEYQLLDASGNPIDLTNYNEVRFLMQQKDGSTLTIDGDTAGNVFVTDAENGKVKYEWKSVDTDEGGVFEAEWEVKYSNGSIETFPNTTFITIRINDDLSDA